MNTCTFSQCLTPPQIYTTYFSGEDGGVMATVASAESLPDEDDMPE